MKKEIQKINKASIERIQKEFGVKKESKDFNYFNKLKQKTDIYLKALEYKEKLDEGIIKEEEIPKEYIEEIRKIYYKEILRFKEVMDDNK